MRVKIHIKKLYQYVLETFLPLFLMTFAICLFLVLMQFLWKYVEDMVGKGLGVGVLAEMFGYAALSLVPMALPLAILLASLMAFGNLGEDLELLAIKAAGIPLLRTMKPLIIFIAFVSIGAFFFQNNAMPKIQPKMFSLLLSIRQKSPELDIPEGVFYKEIDGYNLYVEKKNRKTGVLYDVFIYDIANGFNNMAVIVCDSAQMGMSEDKKWLVFTMHNGQQFQNFQQDLATGNRPSSDFVPYARESFDEKVMTMHFDANFNRMSAEDIGGRTSSGYVAKDLTELRVSIDSMKHVVDSLNLSDRERMKIHAYQNFRNTYQVEQRDSLIQLAKAQINGLDLDSLFNAGGLNTKTSVVNSAYSRAENNSNDFMFRSLGKIATKKTLNRYWIEWHRKFTVSFACLIFFFIGAPLGSIVRKGGLGMPIVISVILFIIYYILDNVGFKMARDGVWAHWIGCWFSSAILLPLGIFLTYKAMNDSSIMNADTYIRFFKKLFFIREKRNYPRKEVIINEPSCEEIGSLSSELTDLVNSYLNQYGKMGYRTYWLDDNYDQLLSKIKNTMETMLNILSNSKDRFVLGVAEQYPVLIKNVRPFEAGSKMAEMAMYAYPLGGIVKLVSIPFAGRIKKDLQLVERLNASLQDMIEKLREGKANVAS
ncbi:MAG: LptF/LptG family permease [Dysgonamonadaceae bacterium]|jgi:lipopolysaccharide export system permease protein|nr:LptF/LptG family permease [Dysgonamonadaceae bacterium]